jgi:hypothetical protein
MNLQQKLRLSVGMYYPIAIFSCYIIAIAEWGIRRELIGTGTDISHFPLITYFVCGVFFASMGIYQWFKYRIWINTVIGFLLGLLCFQGPFAISMHLYFFNATYFITLIVLAFLVIFNWKVLYGQERFEINARRLFRLAVEHICEASNGFTDRPYVIGEIDASEEEILGFARFMEGRYVARTFREEGMVYLAFSMNRSLYATGHASQVSYVCIASKGRVSVFITRADYRQYRKTYNFDQLCASMGAVIQRFFQYYKQGQEARIITEIKGVR